MKNKLVRRLMLPSILMAEPSRCYPVATVHSNPIIKLTNKFLPALISILHKENGAGRWGWGSINPEGLDFLCVVED